MLLKSYKISPIIAQLFFQMGTFPPNVYLTGSRENSIDLIDKGISIMTEINGKPLYKSYLLRLWSGTDVSNKTWRASLENPHTGERLGFENLERLFAFLMDDICVTNQPDCPDSYSFSDNIEPN
jgi:hypothetical protein